MPQTVLCTVTTQLQAETVLTRLRGTAVASAEISVLFQERAGVLGLAQDRDSFPQTRNNKTSAGAPPIGGIFGLLTDIGIVTIPGAGRHIAAGPIVTALGGGDVTDGLLRMGVPRQRAMQFQAMVMQGSILMAVRIAEPGEAIKTESIMRAAHASDIAVVTHIALVPEEDPQQPTTIA
jgi:hypothetical protein